MEGNQQSTDKTQANSEPKSEKNPSGEIRAKHWWTIQANMDFLEATPVSLASIKSSLKPRYTTWRKSREVYNSINDIADEEASSTSISPGVKLRKTKSGKCDRKAQSAITEVKNELMMECLKVMKTPESSATAGPSAEASFASYITEKLKLLDNRRRMIAEKRISDIIWELQMDMEQSMTSGSDLSLTLSQPHYPVASSFYQWSSWLFV